MAIKKWKARFQLNLDASREVTVDVDATTQFKAEKYALKKCIKEHKCIIKPRLLDIEEVKE